MRFRFMCCGLLGAIWAIVAGCGPNVPPSPIPSVVASPTATVAPARATDTPVVPVARPSPTSGPSGVVTVAPDSASRRLTVTLESFHFSPATISARVGQPIRLNLENTDSLLHEFAIDNSDLTVSVQPHTAQTLALVFTMPGTYTFACNLNVEGDHRSLGMVGTIVVEP